MALETGRAAYRIGAARAPAVNPTGTGRRIASRANPRRKRMIAFGWFFEALCNEHEGASSRA